MADQHVTDLLARAPNDTAEQRVLDATKKDAEESLFTKFGKTMDQQNRVLADLASELRYLRQTGPDKQLEAQISEMRTKLINVEARSHVNEAALNVMTEVRDEIRALVKLVRSALNGSGGQHT